MNRVVHIIHPKDETTDFLEHIYADLEDTDSTKINLLRIKNREEHTKIFTIVPEIPVGNLIVFLGHGTSTGLSGAVTSDYDYKVFISDQQLKIFKNKEILFLTCRSNQYLRKFYKESGLKSAIGFPNMITDRDEVDFHDEPERITEITQNDIDKYKQILTCVIKNSLNDYIKYELNTKVLHSRIKMRLNKELIKHYKSLGKNKGKTTVGQMLTDLINGLIIVNNF